MPHPVAIAVANRPLADGLGFVQVVDNLEGEQVQLDLLAQAGVGLGLVDRVIHLVGIVGDRLVGGEIELLLE